MLRTNARRLQTFVDVSTCFAVGEQFIALIAVAIVTGECVDAFVATLMDLHFGTFVNVAMQRLVRFVSAIGHFVTDELIVDALAICTCELTSDTRRILLLRTAHFIRTIATIIFAVATIL